MNIKDMYSVFEHDEQFAIRMLTWNNCRNVHPNWSYLYLTNSNLWVDKYAFQFGNGLRLEELQYFGSKQSAEDYIDNYIKDLECF